MRAHVSAGENSGHKRGPPGRLARSPLTKRYGCTEKAASGSIASNRTLLYVDI